jgi:hypothetical protein
VSPVFFSQCPDFPKIDAIYCEVGSRRLRIAIKVQSGRFLRSILMRRRGDIPQDRKTPVVIMRLEVTPKQCKDTDQILLE